MTSPQKPVMNPTGSSMPTVLTIFVASPCVPRAAMKAKARMMPPMLAATPENASDAVAQPARPLQADDDEGEQGADQPAEHGADGGQLERLGEVAAERPAHRLAHRRDVGVLGLLERLDGTPRPSARRGTVRGRRRTGPARPTPSPPAAARSAREPAPDGGGLDRRFDGLDERRRSDRWARRRHRTTQASATIGPQFSASTAWAAAIWSAVGKATCSISSAGGRLASMSSVIMPFSTSVA